MVVERILPGGLGLAHAGGRTVMVPLTAPGDRVRVHIDRVKGNVAFASIQEVIEASPARVEPPCPYFGRCGGCDFQQLNYPAQLAAKSEIIRDCLRRIGGVGSIPDFEIAAAPSAWHYRARAQWQYDAMRKRLGYFESGSRRVCDVVECAVLAPELQSELESLRVRMQQGALPDDARHFRVLSGDEEISIVDDHGRNPMSQSRQVGIVGGPSSVRDITRTVHGENYRLNATSFFQANHALAPALIDSAVGAEEGKTAVELYCGVGLFTLPLARRFETVVAVEGDTVATEFARHSLAQANLANVYIVNNEVAVWLENPTSSYPDDIDLLLLDPPRTGAESRVISGILRLQPQRICYVSCDPATLARDLKKLTGGGYKIDRLAAFDMFPQTHHVETVAHLAICD
ncbi:MAG TPA: class I SAM-dependent RNA methyltransferase [Pyrinomonadaceae bacterium]